MHIQAVGFQGDVRRKEDAERVVELTIQEFGRLDILVNNAAGNFLVAAEDLSPNGFRTGRYVYRCLWICVYIHVCMCVSMCVCTHAYMYLCVCIHVCMYVSIYMLAFVTVLLYIFIMCKVFLYFLLFSFRHWFSGHIHDVPCCSASSESWRHWKNQERFWSHH